MIYHSTSLICSSSRLPLSPTRHASLPVAAPCRACNSQERWPDRGYKRTDRWKACARSTSGFLVTVSKFYGDKRFQASSRHLWFTGRDFPSKKTVSGVTYTIRCRELKRRRALKPVYRQIWVLCPTFIISTSPNACVPVYTVEVEYIRRRWGRRLGRKRGPGDRQTDQVMLPINSLEKNDLFSCIDVARVVVTVGRGELEMNEYDWQEEETEWGGREGWIEGWIENVNQMTVRGASERLKVDARCPVHHAARRATVHVLSLKCPFRRRGLRSTSVTLLSKNSEETKIAAMCAEL